MKPKGETVDAFIFRLLMSNGGSNNSLHLVDYQADNAGLFFKRHRYSDEQQIRGFTNAVLAHSSHRLASINDHGMPGDEGSRIRT
jgi:hypothetical protein